MLMTSWSGVKTASEAEELHKSGCVIVRFQKSMCAFNYFCQPASSWVPEQVFVSPLKGTIVKREEETWGQV
jgi:hypothetical protein